MSTLLQFKWDKKGSDIAELLKRQLDAAIKDFKKQMAEVIYNELSVQMTGPSVGTEYYKDKEGGKEGKIPVDTGTFIHSWRKPQEVDGDMKIVNKLPSRYIQATRGYYHQGGKDIAGDYNIYILEGFAANAPEYYATTSNKWEYMNRAEGKLLDMSLLLWKYEQGGLGISPHVLMNSLLRAKVRMMT